MRLVHYHYAATAAKSEIILLWRKCTKAADGFFNQKILGKIFFNFCWLSDIRGTTKNVLTEKVQHQNLVLTARLQA